MLRCARKKAAQWERLLRRYGLGNDQFRRAGVQQLTTNAVGTFPHAHDPETRGPWYSQHDIRQRYSYADLISLGLVPAHRAVRQVPDWALDDNRVRAVLLYLFPRLFVTRNPRDCRDKLNGQGLRHRAGIMALVIYRAYRQVLSDRVIAEELGISPSAVSNRLDKVKQAADELFGKRKGVTVRGTLGAAMFEEGLVNLIAGNSGVNAILGTNRGDKTNGIFPLLAPKEVTIPYIIFEQVSNDTNETLEGVNKLQDARYRFRCYAADYPTAMRLYHKLKMALAGFTGTLTDADATPVQYCTPVFEAALPIERELRATIWGRVIDFKIMFVDTAS